MALRQYDVEGGCPEEACTEMAILQLMSRYALNEGDTFEQIAALASASLMERLP